MFIKYVNYIYIYIFEYYKCKRSVLLLKFYIENIETQNVN